MVIYLVYNINIKTCKLTLIRVKHVNNIHNKNYNVTKCILLVSSVENKIYMIEIIKYRINIYYILV